MSKRITFTDKEIDTLIQTLEFANKEIASSGTYSRFSGYLAKNLSQRDLQDLAKKLNGGI